MHPAGPAPPHQHRHRRDRYQFLPCRSTLEDTCPACAKRAKSLREQQCRDGWHLEHEPDLTPAPPDETQEYWLTLRAHAQVRRDTAIANGQDTAELDELITELDDELAACGVRGNITSRTNTGDADDGTGKRRARSTRRRQDAPELPKRPMSDRTTGAVFTAPDGKTWRPSMFLTLTCDSYGKVGPDGTPADPDQLRLPAGRPGRDPLPGPVRPAHPEPAPLPRLRRPVLRHHRTPETPRPARPHRLPRRHLPHRPSRRHRRHLPPGLVATRRHGPVRGRPAARLARTEPAATSTPRPGRSCRAGTRLSTPSARRTSRSTSPGSGPSSTPRACSPEPKTLAGASVTSPNT